MGKTRGVHLKLEHRFLFFLIITSIAPLLVVGRGAYELTTVIVQEEVRDFAEAAVQQQRRYLELSLQQVESLAANISSIEEIQAALAAPNAAQDDYASLATQARIGYILSGYTHVNGLVSIDILTQAGAHFHVGDTLDVKEIRDDVRDRLYAQALTSPQSVLWPGVEDNVNARSKQARVVTAAKLLRTIDATTLEETPVGLLLINLSIDVLHEQLAAAEIGPDAYTVVLDGQGRLVFHPDKNRIGAAIGPEFLQRLNRPHGSFVLTLNGEPTFAAYARSELNDWMVTSFVPLRTLARRSEQIRTNTLWSVIGGLVLVLLAGAYVTRQILNPLRAMKQMLQQLQAGVIDWSARLPISRVDEIGDLARWFNLSLDTLLAKQRAEAEILELNAVLEQRVTERTAELQQVNAALQQEIIERTRAEGQIRARLEEKEVLLREVNHRVKNNLQIISSLLHMQKSSTADPGVGEMLRESQNRIRSMALIHQRLYDSSDLAHIDFAGYLRDLTGSLMQAYQFNPGCVRMHLGAENLRLDLATALPCGLIVNELVSNALKYAFPTGDCGFIEVDVQQQESGEILLHVGDSGRGLPQGMDLDRFTTLGLKLVVALVRQLDGEIEIKNDPGAQFFIRFPSPRVGAAR